LKGNYGLDGGKFRDFATIGQSSPQNAHEDGLSALLTISR
jgi:hypothetical protein